MSENEQALRVANGFKELVAECARLAEELSDHRAAATAEAALANEAIAEQDQLTERVKELEHVVQRVIDACDGSRLRCEIGGEHHTLIRIDDATVRQLQALLAKGETT